MSTQRGNVSRSRPQKHQNKTAFKNNLHDTSHTTKFINRIEVTEVCERCKDIIEWKIKFKKYKTLKNPKKCIKCEEKNIFRAYNVICKMCHVKYQLCRKCCRPKATIPASLGIKEQLQIETEVEQMMQVLPERKRRTFLRYITKIPDESSHDTRNQQIISKFRALRVPDESSDEDSVDTESHSDSN